MENRIVEYIRTTNGRKKSVLVAGRVDNENEFFVGYSLCHKDDKFNRTAGINMAIQRAKDLANGRGITRVPSSVCRKLNTFLTRCIRYYKGLNAPLWLTIQEQ